MNFLQHRNGVRQVHANSIVVAGLAACMLAASARLFDDHAARAAVAETTTVAVAVSADTFVATNAPSSPFGGATIMDIGFEGQTQGVTNRALVRFDNLGVPSGAMLRSASLRLYLFDAVGGDVAGGTTTRIEACRAAAHWEESSATWNNQPASATPCTAVDVGSTNGIAQWDVTGAVQSWLANPSQNHGFLLRATNESRNNLRSFQPKEWLDVQLPAPELVVDYTTAPTSNDDCGSAIVIPSDGPWPYHNVQSTTGASITPAEPLSCDGQAHSRSVWYRWTAPAAGTLDVSTCNSGYDTLLTVWAASSCANPGTPLVCGDDECGTQAHKSVTVAAGATHLIRVSDYGAAGPGGQLDLLVDFTRSGGGGGGTTSLRTDRGCGAAATYEVGQPVTFFYRIGGAARATVRLRIFKPDGSFAEPVNGTVIDGGREYSTSGSAGAPVGTRTVVLYQLVTAGYIEVARCTYGVSDGAPRIIGGYVRLERGCREEGQAPSYLVGDVLDAQLGITSTGPFGSIVVVAGGGPEGNVALLREVSIAADQAHTFSKLRTDQQLGVVRAGGTGRRALLLVNAADSTLISRCTFDVVPPTNTPTSTRTSTSTPTATHTSTATSTPTPTPAVGAVRGRVRLERRPTSRGATVALGARSAQTDDDGNFVLAGLPVGRQTLCVTHPSYLRGGVTVDVIAGEEIEAPDEALLAGDVNQDGRIDVGDWTRLDGGWSTVRGAAGWAAELDITDDGVVDLLDAVAVQYNWGAARGACDSAAVPTGTIPSTPTNEPAPTFVPTPTNARAPTFVPSPTGPPTAPLPQVTSAP